MTSALAGRCPCCGQGAVFAGFLTLNETCAHCGARFERWSGSWTGPTVLAYGAGGASGIVVAFVLYATGHFFDHVEILLAAVSCGVALLALRPAKSLWIGLMYDWGYIYPD